MERERLTEGRRKSKAAWAPAQGKHTPERNHKKLQISTMCAGKDASHSQEVKCSASKKISNRADALYANVCLSVPPKTATAALCVCVWPCLLRAVRVLHVAHVRFLSGSVCSVPTKPSTAQTSPTRGQEHATSPSRTALPQPKAGTSSPGSRLRYAQGPDRRLPWLKTSLSDTETRFRKGQRRALEAPW
jgi:hypothetical protein